jgi:hypothetical protein
MSTATSRFPGPLHRFSWGWALAGVNPRGPLTALGAGRIAAANQSALRARVWAGACRTLKQADLGSVRSSPPSGKKLRYRRSDLDGPAGRSDSGHFLKFFLDLDSKAASHNSELVLTMFLLCSSFRECTSPQACAVNGRRSRRRLPPMKQGSMLREETWRRSIRRRGFSIAKPDLMKPSSRGIPTGSRSRKRVSNRLAKLARGPGRSPRADGLLPSRGFKTHSAHSRGWSHPPRPGQLQKGYQKNFFIWSGRNSLKSLGSKK